MAANLSQEVTDRVRTCLRVLSAFLTEGAELASDLLGVAQPHLEEEDETPAFFPVIVALGRTLRGALNRLVEADEELYALAARESVLREKYKELVRNVGSLIVGLRRIVLAHFLQPNLEALGLQPLDVRESIVVMRRTELIADQFEADEVAELLGSPRFDEPEDVQKYVGQVRTAASDVLELTEELNEASRLTTRARLRKKELMAEYDKLFVRSARIFEDSCRIAGKDELADRVRSVVSRRGGRPEPDEPTADEGDPIGDVEEVAEQIAASEEHPPSDRGTLDDEGEGVSEETSIA